jgi:hypothetical protein
MKRWKSQTNLKERSTSVKPHQAWGLTNLRTTGRHNGMKAIEASDARGVNTIYSFLISGVCGVI